MNKTNIDNKQTPKKQMSDNHLLFMLVQLLMQKDPKQLEKFKEFGDDMLVSFTKEISTQIKEKQNNPELSEDVQKKLRIAWLDMFFGIAWRRWMQNGCSLASAWMGAYSIMKMKLNSEFTKGNPGLKYLNEFAEKRQAETIKFIKTNDHTNKTMNVPDGQKAEYDRIGNYAYNNGVSLMKETLTPLNPKKEQTASVVEKPKIVKFPQLTPAMIKWMQDQQKQRSIA